jgi:EAL and modified HD-GYP domain-containing signal transduction protein
MSARIDSARSAAIVRKPVFNRSLDVVAYEVVLGDGSIEEIEIEDGRVVVNTGTDLDLAAISDDKPVQLPVSAGILEQGLPAELDPEKIMLVLGAGIDASEQTVAALERLRSSGYRIVLGDWVTNTQLHPLVRLAHVVKINVDGTAGPIVAKQIALLRTAGVELMAEGVASYDELRNATKAGFTQFEGSFLSRPDGFRKTRAPAGQLAALELITMLQDPDAEISDIADVIRRDVSLSYRILKVVNSAHYALPRPLGSVEEAVVLVGTKQIVSWVGMLSMTGINNKPSELTRTAMVRARVCETLAQCLDRADTQRFYLVGLFSVIEALLDVPAEQALRSLPLAVEIIDAITSGNGIMGEALRGVIAYEQGNWEQAHIIGVHDEVLSDAFHLAILETDKVWSQVTGSVA